MNTKFTPGPWTLGLETDNERAQVISQDGQHIAYVECDPVPANARLISAAPELLGALEDCLVCLNADSDMQEDCATEIAMARAAIAKAKGEV